MNNLKNIGYKIIFIQIIFIDILYAYIDPGSVAAFLQLIIATVIGFIIYARNYIAHLLRKLFHIITKKR